MIIKIIRLFYLLLFFPCLLMAASESPQITAVSIESINSKNIAVNFEFTSAFHVPEQIWLENPDRFVLDFDTIEFSNEAELPDIPAGSLLESMNVFTEGSGTQVSFTLSALPNYQVKMQPNQLRVEFSQPEVAVDEEISNGKITDVLYTTQTEGMGLLSIRHSAEKLPVQYDDAAGRMTLFFKDVQIDSHLLRTFDVRDLESGVLEFSLAEQKQGVLLSVVFEEGWLPVSYQNEGVFSLEFIPDPPSDAGETPVYKGEKISLNFQNIETRAVLQLLADFSDVNIVASDSVTGTVTLRLRDVPWDQALDLILKIKGLDYRRTGNVLLVAPTEELAEQERVLLESTQEIQDLAPLSSDLIQINYAKASALAALLKKDDVSVLSPRGRVTVDERTNTLLIYETQTKLAEVKGLIEKLDRPIRQVLIEAKIIKATDNFEEALGVRFGVSSHSVRHNLKQGGVAGNLTGSNTLATTASSTPADLAFTDRLNVSLPKTLSNASGSGSIAFTIARLPMDTILDLEISALENEGLAEVISSPKLVTANQKTAHIESGEEIPYNETTSSGAASVAFKKAVLRLEVTPQITPDGHIILDMLVNQDSRGSDAGGVPAIDKQEMKTQALVNNGETIVLGGIYKQTSQKNVTKVPLLGDLPLLGRMFRNEQRIDQREELLIFVTPKIIVEDGLTGLETAPRRIKPLPDVRKS